MIEINVPYGKEKVYKRKLNWGIGYSKMSVNDNNQESQELSDKTRNIDIFIRL